MTVTCSGNAHWQGNLNSGRGIVATQSGALRHSYRFWPCANGKDAIEPLELMAAAHASCFSMALATAIDEANYIAKSLSVTAKVNYEHLDDSMEMTSVLLVVEAWVPEMEETTFNHLAIKAKNNCSMSKALKTEVLLETEFSGT